MQTEKLSNENDTSNGILADVCALNGKYSSFYYLKVAPQFNEPLYTRPVRTVV